MKYNTLNESLESRMYNEYDQIDLIAIWPLGENVNYNETNQVIVGEGKMQRLISVSRDEKGMYEEPVTYLTNW